ncbi:MAG: hypothetical protein IH820_18180 [Bacteroidetes bacterium]|nr:hypothetical protein [Bacteroidota bacterium]
MDKWPFEDAEVAERFALGVVKAGVGCEANLERYLNDLPRCGIDNLVVVGANLDA